MIDVNLFTGTHGIRLAAEAGEFVDTVIVATPLVGGRLSARTGAAGFLLLAGAATFSFSVAESLA